jgi:hypothetical protein
VKNSELSVNELILAYWRFAEAYYVKDGGPTSEQDVIRFALRFVKERYGHDLARLEERPKVSDHRIRAAAVHDHLPEAGSGRPLPDYYRLGDGFIHFFLPGSGTLGTWPGWP